ncbi:ATP-binding protein [Streptomyces sp. NBC_01007]|nr:ATP-binding protein [Streptomyces sp. NBC_01007]
MYSVGAAVVDIGVGLAYVTAGLVVSPRRRTAVAALMIATGGAWLAGDLAAVVALVHRGPLVHLLLSYPDGRLRRPALRAVVALAYADALAYPLARSEPVTIGLAVTVVAAAGARVAGANSSARRSYALALAAAGAVMLAPAAGAAARLAGEPHDRPVLWAYEVALVGCAVTLPADLRWRRRRDALTGLVIDLGDLEEGATLREKLADALGDPALTVGYWLAETGGYVDETGLPVDPADAAPETAVTPLEEDGGRVGVLLHDRAVLDDPGLVQSVAALAKLALVNARLQAQVRDRVAEVDASRRRIVAAADEERDRLERELAEGAERRLGLVAELLDDAPSGLPGQVRAARAQLLEFARGVHPRTLTESGLAAALDELAREAPLPVRSAVGGHPLPPALAATVYFVVSEALANTVKHAHATAAQVTVAVADDVVTVEVADDGVGGVDPAHGSGLRGLADRVDVQGGTLHIDSPADRGTRVLARLPVTP